MFNLVISAKFRKWLRTKSLPGEKRMHLSVLIEVLDPIETMPQFRCLILNLRNRHSIKLLSLKHNIFLFQNSKGFNRWRVCWNKVLSLLVWSCTLIWRNKKGKKKLIWQSLKKFLGKYPPCTIKIWKRKCKNRRQNWSCPRMLLSRWSKALPLCQSLRKEM